MIINLRSVNDRITIVLEFTKSKNKGKKKQQNFYIFSSISLNSEDELLPKSKHLATEEKVMNAFKNLNLDATTFDKNKKKCDNFKFNFKDYENKFNLGNFDDNEDDKDFSGILLSDELKNTLKQSKETSDYELLRKLSNKELVI